jgi:hypothetical protein
VAVAKVSEISATSAKSFEDAMHFRGWQRTAQGVGNLEVRDGGARLGGREDGEQRPADSRSTRLSAQRQARVSRYPSERRETVDASACA